MVKQKLYTSIFLSIAILLIFANGVLAHTDDPDSGLELTVAEEQFIRDNPEIVLGSGASFEPFCVQNGDGSISGYDVDIAKLITQKTGLKIRFELGPWGGIQKRALGRELDGLSTASVTAERATHYNFSSPYFRSTVLVIVKNGNPQKIYRLQDTHGKRVALQRGNVLFDGVSEHFGGTLVKDYYESQYDLIQAVADGRADFTIIDDTAFYIAERMGLRSFIEGAFPVGNPFDIVFALRNDQPELVSIINKGLQGITESEKIKVRQRWFSIWNKTLSADPEPPSFGSAETLFLAENNVLKECVYSGDLPYQQLDSSGQYIGIAADYNAIFQDRLGVMLLPVTDLKNKDPLLALASGSCDVVVLADKRDLRLNGLDITTTYLSFPYVVATTHDKLISPQDKLITNRPYAITKGATIIPALRKKYPQIRLVETSDARAGMALVLDGSVFGFIDSLATISYTVQKETLSQIKIAGTLPLTIDFGVATNKNKPHLGKIFQKVVGSLTEQENQQIRNYWLAVKYEQGIDYRLIWKIIFVAGFIVIVTIYWSYRLGKEKKKVEQALQAERTAIQQNLNFTDMLLHEYRTPLSVITTSLDLLDKKNGSKNSGIDNQLAKIRKSSDRLRNIFEISLDEKRINDGSLRLDKQKINLGDILKTAIEYTRHTYPDYVVNYRSLASGEMNLNGENELMMTALTNLLDNACKYSEPAKDIFTLLSRENDFANITITNTGIEIQPDELAQVFDKYYRAPGVGAQTGAGVGLYLVKKIINMHHGKVSITSNKEGVTKVQIQLPLEP